MSDLWPKSILLNVVENVVLLEVLYDVNLILYYIMDWRTSICADHERQLIVVDNSFVLKFTKKAALSACRIWSTGLKERKY